MKQAYLEPKNWTDKKREIFDKIIEVVEDFEQQGYKMTLRQLYYQLVSQDIILNQDSEYKKLGSLLNDSRYYGFIDWDFIEDRIRVPKIKIAIEDIALSLGLSEQAIVKCKTGMGSVLTKHKIKHTHYKGFRKISDLGISGQS